MQLGHYEESAYSWKRALEFSPDNRRASEGWQYVRTLLEVKQTLKKRLPADRIITRIRAFHPHSGQTFWAVLHGQNERRLEPLCCPPNMHLTLFTDLPDCRQIGASFPLKDPRMDDGPFDSVTCHAIDMTKDGIPELVVHELSPGGSWSPSQMEVFAWRGGRLMKILQAQSSEPLCLEDINQNGTYQVRNCYEIGNFMCHAEQPRWSDVYAYQNGAFVLANRRFPKAFTQWPESLRKTLQKYPDDDGIQAYLCLTYALLGREQKAKPLRQQAVATFREHLKSADENERLGTQAYKNCVQNYLIDLQR
jgi:hypothetical protein